MSFRFFPAEITPQGPTHDGPINLAECKLVEISHRHYQIVDKLHGSAVGGVKNLKGAEFKCVNVGELGKGVVTDEQVLGILNSSSDLKSGVYEGGFKTWECTYDLVAYIYDNVTTVLPEHKTTPLRILDLGCGSGLLGLSILEFAKRRNVPVLVDFQDYNSEVIDHVTIPNTILNFNDEVVSTCRYFSGDWDSFAEVVDTKYDLIVSSETIYNLEYFTKIIRVIKKTLQDHGGLYLAAKTFYFGVGGGTHAFLNMVGGDGGLNASTVQAFKEGVKREIIHVTRCAK